MTTAINRRREADLRVLIYDGGTGLLLTHAETRRRTYLFADETRVALSPPIQIHTRPRFASTPFRCPARDV